MSGLGLPPKASYQGALAHPPMALRHVPRQSGSPMWGKRCVAASSTLQQVLAGVVAHVHIPLLWADDTWVLSNLRILGPRV